MAHFLRTVADWITGMVPTEAHFDDLDEKTKKAINGDDGGTWIPAAPIVITGAGVDIFMDPAGDVFPRLPAGHAGRGRAIARSASQLILRDDAGTFDESGREVQSPGTGGEAEFALPLHHGAKLIQVEFAIIPSEFYATVPSDWPTIDVRRYPYNVGHPAPTVSLSTTGVATYPAEALAVWTDNTAAKLLTFTCDQNHTIDTSAYVYTVRVVDANGGTGTLGIRWNSIRATYTDIADMRFP